MPIMPSYSMQLFYGGKRIRKDPSDEFDCSFKKIVDYPILPS
jgi:hypothetical protein